MSSTRKLAAIRLDQGRDEQVERRSGFERRRFSYTEHIPERRTGRDRQLENQLEKLERELTKI